VWGAGGNVRFMCDRLRAEHIAVPVTSLRRKPNGLAFVETASVGISSWQPGAAWLRCPLSRSARRS
jgi:hypothetical protein